MRKTLDAGLPYFVGQAMDAPVAGINAHKESAHDRQRHQRQAMTKLNTIQAAFQAMTVAGSTAQYDAPTSDPYGIAFTTVAIGPLAAFDQRKRYSLGIVAGPEARSSPCPMSCATSQ